MARSMPSFGMFSARGAVMAAQSRAFIAGSGMPSLAAVVISRASLLNSLERALSWRPLRCMMFLNCEWPAIAQLAVAARYQAREARSTPECGLGLFELAAKPDRRDPPSEA